MSKQNLKLLSWITAAILILGFGAAIGGGVGYALAQEPKGGTGIVVEPATLEPGILVAGVVPDSPAAAAGIKRGDILLEIEGQVINQPTELISHLQNLSVGDQVEIKLLHGDAEKIVAITLGEQNGRPYLGVAPCGGGIHQITVQDFKPAARVMQVAPDSPADQAGLEPGDMIVAVDGQTVNQEHNLSDLIGMHAPGDSVTLTVERPGEEAREVTVTLAENPNKAGAAFLGVNFRLFPQMMMLRRMPFQPGRPHFDQMPFNKDFLKQIEPGIFIQDVAEDGPAAAAGLSQGDMITAINGEPVQNPRGLAKAVAQLKPGDTLTLTVSRPGQDESREVTVTLGENPNEAGKAYLGIRPGGFFNIFISPDGNGGAKGMRFFFDEQPFDFNFEVLPFDEFDYLPFEQFDFEQWCDDTGTCFGNTI
jgi:S1-C subfamily serine protease